MTTKSAKCLLQSSLNKIHLMPSDPIKKFLDIVRRNNTSVRVTPDGLFYAADLHRKHANEVLRDLSDEYFEQSNYAQFKRQKVLTLSNTIQLVMVLPLKEAGPARSKFIKILFGGAAAWIIPP